MFAQGPATFIRELLGWGEPGSKSGPGSLLVKICGTRNAESALEAIKAGADLIGIILVPGRGRHVSYKDAVEISKVVHQTSITTGTIAQDRASSQASDFFADAALNISSHRPLLVGVF